VEETDDRHRRLLRARRERPRRRRAAEKRDELALVIDPCDSKGLRCLGALKADFGSLAHFARCLGRRRFAASGGRREDRLSGLFRLVK
jgi:hypothetical protein